MSLILKKGIAIDNLCVQLLLSIIVINDLFKELKKDCVITACTNGTHSYSSLHWCGRAVDIRSKVFGESDEKKKIVIIVREKLGSLKDYDFILENLNLENEHFHLEWQPKAKLPLAKPVEKDTQVA
jgi:hypothetical protein